MEQKKEYAKTKDLPVEKFLELLDDSYGFQLKLSDVPVEYHVIMDITAPVEVKVVPPKTENDLEVTYYKLPCKYENKGLAEAVNLIMYVGEKAIKRLQEKYPADSYVGMKAFFNKTKFEGKFPQFINPIKNPIEVKKKEDLLKPQHVASATLQTPENNSNSSSSLPPPVTNSSVLPEIVDKDLKVINELINNPQLMPWVTFAKENVDKFVEAYNGTADNLKLDHIDLSKKEELYKTFLARL